MSPYKVLGLPSSANLALVKSRYRSLAKRYHPDISKEENAKEKFIKITEAYELILEGPKKRTRKAGPKKDHKEERRAKARKYAHMEYQEFLRNNAAFKKEWYYGLTKYFSYGLIGFGYLFSLALGLLPVWVYWLTQNFLISGMMVFMALLSFYVFVQTKRFSEGIKPYFSDYDG